MTTIPEMQRKGWGNPLDKDYARDHIVAFTEAGRTFRVRREVKPLFHALILMMESNGVDISKGTLDDWSYVVRPIRGYEGTATYSMHSWGLAIDIDATKNVLGSHKTSFPVAATKRAAADCSLDWGYLWTGRPDPMHFEFNGSHDQLAAAKARLKNRHPLIWRKVAR